MRYLLDQLGNYWGHIFGVTFIVVIVMVALGLLLKRYGPKLHSKPQEMFIISLVMLTISATVTASLEKDQPPPSNEIAHGNKCFISEKSSETYCFVNTEQPEDRVSAIYRSAWSLFSNLLGAAAAALMGAAAANAASFSHARRLAMLTKELKEKQALLPDYKKKMLGNRKDTAANDAFNKLEKEISDLNNEINSLRIV